MRIFIRRMTPVCVSIHFRKLYFSVRLHTPKTKPSPILLERDEEEKEKNLNLELLKWESTLQYHKISISALLFCTFDSASIFYK
jgi:hypothetical protein